MGVTRGARDQLRQRRTSAVAPLIAVIVASLVTCSAAATAQKAARTADPRHALFGKGAVPRIEIVLGAQAADALRKEPRAWVRAGLRENGKTSYEGLGVKIKGAGGSTRDFDDKPALTVDVDRFAKGQTYHGLRKFHLNNSVQDESYLNELIGSEIFRAAGLAAPRVGHARVWIDGRDVGLYVVKEGFDEVFVERWFGAAAGSLYDGGFCQDIDAALEKDVGKPKDERSDLARLLAACREPDPSKRWPLVADALDVESFLTFVALEMMTGHWDGYSLNHNNYRLWFDARDGRARFLPHGMDQLFEDPDVSILEPPGAIVAGTVLLNPRWRARYRERIRELLPHFGSERQLARIDTAVARLMPAVASLGPDAAAHHAERVRELKRRVELRDKRLRDQAELPDPRPLALVRGRPLALAAWHTNSECEDAALVAEKNAGERFYVIRAGKSGVCVASWRKRVMLEKGRYRLEATVRIDGFAPLPDGSRSGACARIGGADAAVRVTDAKPKDPLAFEFTVVEAAQFVELVAEFRASKGEARFDADRLRITRL